jgi:hypothetical protein
MEQPETNETAPIESVEAREASPAVAPARSVAGPVITQGTPGCPTCGAGAGAPDGGTASSSYVYALGQIETRFPRPSVEKEVAQATGRAETAGHTDQQAFYHVLSRRENRYLARQLCWILSIQGLETYILQPRDPADIDLLIGALNNTEPLPWISTVIGVRGPIAPPEFCNGLMIPIVAFDQIPCIYLDLPRKRRSTRPATGTPEPGTTPRPTPGNCLPSSRSPRFPISRKSWRARRALPKSRPSESRSRQRPTSKYRPLPRQYQL